MAQLTEAEIKDISKRAQAVRDNVLIEAEIEGVPLAPGGAYRLAYVALRADLLNDKRNQEDQ